MFSNPLWVWQWKGQFTKWILLGITWNVQNSYIQNTHVSKSQTIHLGQDWGQFILTNFLGMYNMSRYAQKYNVPNPTSLMAAGVGWGQQTFFAKNSQNIKSCTENSCLPAPDPSWGSEWKDQFTKKICGKELHEMSRSTQNSCLPAPTTHLGGDRSKFILRFFARNCMKFLIHTET